MSRSDVEMQDGFKSLLQICPGRSSHFNKDYRPNVQFISILLFDAMLNPFWALYSALAQNNRHSHGCSVAALIWHILFWVSIFRKLNIQLFLFCACQKPFPFEWRTWEKSESRKKYRQKCQLEVDQRVQTLWCVLRSWNLYTSLWHAMASFQVWT